MELVLEIIREYILKHSFTHIKRGNGFHFNGFCLKEDGQNLLFEDREDGKMIIPIVDIDVIELARVGGWE